MLNLVPPLTQTCLAGRAEMLWGHLLQTAIAPVALTQVKGLDKSNAIAGGIAWKDIRSDGRDQSISRSSIAISDGGNLNAAYIDMEAEDEMVIEAEPAQPKRKLIATLQVSAGVMDMASLSTLALWAHSSSLPPQWILDWAEEPHSTVC